MASSEPQIARRGALRVVSGGLMLPLLFGCSEDVEWTGIDVTGTLPDLAFTMTRARDGQTVSAADYRGDVVALFFGYTFCPDICPMTLANMAAVTDKLGERARGLSILFVTVDPTRDTPEVLARYMANFSPRATGLRGSDNQLTRLARRYKVTYKVDPGGDYSVTHGPSVYIFDKAGAARVMLPDFDTADADIDGVAGDIDRLLDA